MKKWDYRVVKLNSRYGIPYFTIMETYYNDNNDVIGFETDDIARDTFVDLKENMTRMNDAFLKPVIEANEVLENDDLKGKKYVKTFLREIPLEN